MTATLLPNGKQQFFDALGTPLSGGSVAMYVPGTTTPKNTWQDAAQTILNMNPVILNSAGEALIYGAGQYRQVVKDSNGNLIWDQLTSGYSISDSMAPVVSASTAYAALSIFGQAEAVPDWLSPLITSSFNLTQKTLFPVLSQAGQLGVVGATRTSDNTTDPGAELGIGLMGFVSNDAIGGNQQQGFAGYFEAQQKVGAGFTAGVEIDAVNQSGVVSQINPYSLLTAPTFNIGLWVAAGGARSGVVNSSAAMAVLGNGAIFDKGLVFMAGSIASNEAIAMASGHALQWWGGAGATSFINSVATSSNFGITITDTVIAFCVGEPGGSETSSGSLLVENVANAVNFVDVAGGITGSAVRIKADGSDANINLQLLPKGSGYLDLGGPALTLGASGGSGTLPAAPVGFLTVQFNGDGGTYKIPLYNV